MGVYDDPVVVDDAVLGGLDVGEVHAAARVVDEHRPVADGEGVGDCCT